jgi:hypothetical protein
LEGARQARVLTPSFCVNKFPQSGQSLRAYPECLLGPWLPAGESV